MLPALEATLPDEKNPPIYFRLPAALKEAVQRRADAKDLTVAQYMRGLIRADLEPRA